MRPSPLALLALAAAAGCVTTGPNPYQAAFESWQTLDRFIAEPANLPRMIDMMTDDVFIFDQGGEGKPIRLQGKPAVRQYLQQVTAQVERYSATLSDVHISSTRDAAWITATWQHSMTTAGQETTWRQLGSFFLRRDDKGEWRIAGWHASHAEIVQFPQVAPPQPSAPAPATPLNPGPK